MKVLMSPHRDSFGKDESGIRRVVNAMFKHLPDYGIDLVPKGSKEYDLHVAHAGTTGKDVGVAYLHGVYWSAEYNCSEWEHKANRNIIDALRVAKQVIVPSEWVAETIRRDMRFNPHVIGHGIDVDKWKPMRHESYVLWNKNRNFDVCDPTPMVRLAEKRPTIDFVTTYMPRNHKGKPRNVGLIKTMFPKKIIKDTHLLPHEDMKLMIQKSMVYLSTTKETFGIGVLEAMAAGVPVLGFDWGGNCDLVQHGVNGYLAQPNNIDELAYGLDYCVANRHVLGENGREMAKQWTWEEAARKVADVLNLAVAEHPYKDMVSVVIPSYNYADKLPDAVKSAINQTVKPLEVIIVDDESKDDTQEVGKKLASKYDLVKYFRKPNGGVANARNYGIERARGEYIICLDADDQIAPKFIRACLPEFKKDSSLGIVYTGLMAIKEDGSSGLSSWPTECDYDKQLHYRNPGNARGLNQVPTCCMFKREAWVRTGGYKQRYAPLGAGSEDAEFFTRIMSIGYGAKKATNAGLFIYSLGTGLISGAKNQNPNLIEPMWLTAHPWAEDREHPFASRATPLNELAHPVRSYDQPVASFVIPVGPGHEEEVKNALDSIESQTYRKWEAIVVWDSDKEPELAAYPYVKVIKTVGKRGAGYARNRGAEMAKGSFLVFLDADDQISPHFLRKCLEAFSQNEAIVYTDYFNSIICEPDDLKNYKNDGIAQYNTRTKEALIHGRASDYDCERAQIQPQKNLYHWCLVTSLIPKKWHNSIGGFDETMESFEDVLYHWMLARKGYCYQRIEEPLVSYKMYTGTRRERASIYTEEGRKIAKKMLEYSKEKLEEIEMGSCSGCGKKRATVADVRRANIAPQDQKVRQIADDDYIMVQYMSKNVGNHHVYGKATGKHYGYRKGGSTFLVHKLDIQSQPHMFRQIPQVQHDTNSFEHVKKEPKPLPEPKKIEEEVPEIDFEEISEPLPPPKPTSIRSIPGVTPKVAEQLEQLGANTIEAVAALGLDGLMKIKGVGETRAQGIMDALDMML